MSGRYRPGEKNIKEILPAEFIAEGTTESKDLRKYREKIGDRTRFWVRFFLNNLSLRDDLLNICLWRIRRSI